jgi:HEAT repeat protein
MARKRKGTPQESIDSILLAMSRRDDIDPDTLSHYFDRLDEEWTEGARDKVLRMLRTNDLTAHSAAVIILSELATDFDLEELEDFVTDPTVSDLAKLTLAPVLKELDSEMADEGILEYLNDPESAMLQMQMRLLELVGQSELGVEAILEDVLSMPVERRLSFVSWLGNSQDPRATNLLLPLLENQSSKVVLAALDALEQLGAIAASQSIPALNHLIATSSNRAVKQRARAVLGRLTMQSAPGVESQAMEEARQQLPLHEARASFVDGAGAQMIMLAWKRPDGLLKGVNILYQDQWGIKDCYGTDEIEPENWSDLVTGIEEQGFISFQVSFEYCQALVAEAIAVSKRSRHKLPIAYTIWRPFIEGDTSARKKAPAAQTMLEPRPYTADLAPLMQRGEDLYQMPEFSSWMFDSLDSLRPYINRYWSNPNVLLDDLGTTQRGRGRRRKQSVSKTFLEDLVTEALTALVDDQWRTLYETRLRRQGALFQVVGRTKDVQLVSAVAAALHPESGVPVQEQSFPRAMMRLSIQQGPFRMMAEALESGRFGPIPMDLLPEDL